MVFGKLLLGKSFCYAHLFKEFTKYDLKITFHYKQLS